MEMSGRYRIPAPRQKVWEALNDPDILRQCIPGCDSLDQDSETELTAKVTAKVGPVKATFSGKVTLSNINAPESYTLSGQGQGGVAGFAKGGADVSLNEDGDTTILQYQATADVGGKLAQIGSRLVKGAAQKTTREFFGNFARVVSDGAEAEELPAEEAPTGS